MSKNNVSIKTMKRHPLFIDRLTAILVEQGSMADRDAVSARNLFSKSSADEFDDFLLEEGLVSREHLLRALSVYYNLESFDVTGFFFERDTLSYFPKDFLLEYAIIPVEADNEIITIVAAHPEEPGLREKIGLYTTNVIEFSIGLKREIIDAIREYYDYADTQEDEVEQAAVDLKIQDDDMDTDIVNLE
jgi:hypothetical protein